MSKIYIRQALFTAFLPLLLAIAGLSQTSRVTTELTTSFTRFDLVRMNASDDLRSFSFSTAGRLTRIMVVPHDLRSSTYRAQDKSAAGDTALDREPSHTYKGQVAGEAGSGVRLTIDDSRVEGYFTSRGERYFIEPASKYSRSARQDEYVIYRGEDAIGAGPLSCGSTLEEKLTEGKTLIDNAIVQSAQPARRVELATEADFEYVAALGGAAQANREILSILNMAEGVYESELNLSISVVFQHTWSTFDPFAGLSAEATVRNFQGYWNANFPISSYPRDAAHLFSAKLNLLSQGWAFVGVICQNPNFAYGMSGYIDWAPAKFLLTTHEIGHNLGANHVSGTQGCVNSLMNAQLSGSTPLSFCSYSQNEIATFTGSHSSCLSPVAGCRFDFDGDSKADISVFRPTGGIWYLNQSANGFTGAQFGQNGDKAVSADYDGDGRADISVYRDGIWYRLDSSTNTFRAAAFGLSTDKPVPADFDGDGKADIAVFRPSTGYWYQLLSSTGGFASFSHGTNGDVPVPADFDGDGKADINVFRPSTGTWYRVNSRTNSFYGVHFGAPGDKAVMGDFDGDGLADVAVWRPSNGGWYVLYPNGSTSAALFGLPTDIPSPADYDGDGKTDISVYRPSTGTWYRLNSGTSSFTAVPFGTSSDLPVPSYYIQ